MKKYYIWTDCDEYIPKTVYSEKEAIEEFSKATEIYNRINGLVGDDAYFDYEHRRPEDKDLSFEGWVDGSDCIWCDVSEFI